VNRQDWIKYCAELVGTFVLVFIGCGSAVIAGKAIGYAGIAFAFGLAVLGMVYAIGGISGCHINPAISVGMLVAGKMKWRDTVMYVIAQCIGAIIAAGILWIVASGLPGYSIATNGLGQNGFGAASPGGYPLAAGFIAEIVLTFIFLLAVLGSTSKFAPAGFAGLGTSVNPARSLGPAVFAGPVALSQLWVFWVAPLIGGILAALLWRFVFERK